MPGDVGGGGGASGQIMGGGSGVRRLQRSPPALVHRVLPRAGPPLLVTVHDAIRMYRAHCQYLKGRLAFNSVLEFNGIFSLEVYPFIRLSVPVLASPSPFHVLLPHQRGSQRDTEHTLVDFCFSLVNPKAERHFWNHASESQAHQPRHTPGGKDQRRPFLF